MSDPALAYSHPYLAERWLRVVGLMWERSYTASIVSASRSYSTQADMYRRWKAGTYNAPSVADPDHVGPETPFGWRIQGSYHMVQQDGYSYALDVSYIGPSPEEATAIYNLCGLHQVVPGEPWHLQSFAGPYWFDAPLLALTPPIASPSTATGPPIVEDDDMSRLVQADDGDIAVFAQTGGMKAWLSNGDAVQEMIDKGLVTKATLDGTPLLVSRTLIDTLITIGPLPVYPPDYAGPKTTH